MFLGEKIKTTRESLGYSPTEFATKVGLSAGYLVNLESGMRKNPSQKTLKLIADGLNTTIDELYKGTTTETIPPTKPSNHSDIDILLDALIECGAISDSNNIDKSTIDVILSVVKKHIDKKLESKNSL